MKIPGPSAKKLLHECFVSDDEPLRVNLKDRANLVRQWNDDFQDVEGVAVSKNSFDRDSRSHTLCRFTIPDSHRGERYYRSHEVRIDHDDDGRVLIRVPVGRGQYETATVHSLQQVDRFVRRVLDFYDRRAALERKRSKVRQLKTRAIEAKIRKMADEDGFEYRIRTDQQKVTLEIRMRASQILRLQIPYTRFEDTIPKVRQIIADLRELADSGLKFGLMSDRLNSVPSWNTQAE